MDKYSFQNCQKIVVFSKDGTRVLLCKREGEADFDGVFSFIGGKMETADDSIINGLKREKDEEVGSEFKIRLYPEFSTNILFTKKDGNIMILPHYYAEYIEGEINLNGEYSEYQWVEVINLESFEPKIPTIPKVVERLLELRNIIKEEQFVTL